MEWKRRGEIVGILLGVYLGYRYLLPAVLPFLAAWMLAGRIYPLAQRIEKKTGMKKSVTGAVIFSFLFAAVGLFFYKGIMELLSQIKAAVSHYYVMQDWCASLLEQLCRMIEDITGIAVSESRAYLLNGFNSMQKELLASLSSGTFTALFHGAKTILMFLSALVVTFISAILIISDMENVQKKIWDYSWLVGTRRVVRRLSRTTVTYLKAQVIIMILVAAVCAGGFWVMKSPYFLILGIGLGVLDVLPLIGTGTFLYPAAVIFLIRGNVGIAGGCVILDIVTSLLREFLEPRLLGEKLGISPISVLASVYLGVILYGGWGVVLGPLAFSTAYEIGKEWDIWD